MRAADGAGRVDAQGNDDAPDDGHLEQPLQRAGQDGHKDRAHAEQDQKERAREFGDAGPRQAGLLIHGFAFVYWFMRSIGTGDPVAVME